MPHLTAVAFRIQNYRNIDDSGWIELERVTNLVGRNESGKTALLQALHKFHPATEIPYVAQREFPRDRFTRDFKDPGNWPVSSVKFKIEGEDHHAKRPARLRDSNAILRRQIKTR
jgi:recombinational DNA repair ATPase RecF